MEFLKKYWWMFLAIIIVLAIGSFIIFNKKDEKFKNIVEINPSKMEEMINNEESFIVVITQTGCSHCEKYLPELDNALKENNLTGYDINVSILNDDEKSILNKYISYSGTPTTVFINEGKEKTTLNRLIGYANKNKINERLKTMGFIK